MRNNGLIITFIIILCILFIALIYFSIACFTHIWPFINKEDYQGASIPDKILNIKCPSSDPHKCIYTCPKGLIGESGCSAETKTPWKCGAIPIMNTSKDILHFKTSPNQSCHASSSLTLNPGEQSSFAWAGGNRCGGDCETINIDAFNGSSTKPFTTIKATKNTGGKILVCSGDSCSYQDKLKESEKIYNNTCTTNSTGVTVSIQGNPDAFQTCGPKMSMFNLSPGEVGNSYWTWDLPDHQCNINYLKSTFSHDSQEPVTKSFETGLKGSRYVECTCQDLVDPGPPDLETCKCVEKSGTAPVMNKCYNMACLGKVTQRPWECNSVPVYNSSSPNDNKVISLSIDKDAECAGGESLTLKPLESGSVIWPGTCTGACSKDVQIDLHDVTDNVSLGHLVPNASYGNYGEKIYNCHLDPIEFCKLESVDGVSIYNQTATDNSAGVNVSVYGNDSVADNKCGSKLTRFNLAPGDKGNAYWLWDKLDNCDEANMNFVFSDNMGNSSPSQILTLKSDWTKGKNPSAIINCQCQNSGPGQQDLSKCKCIAYIPPS